MYIYIYVYIYICIYIYISDCCERTQVLTKKPIDVPKSSQNTPELLSAALLGRSRRWLAALSVSFPYLFHFVSILSPFRSRSFLVPASKRSPKSAGEWSDTWLSHHTAGTAVWISQGMFRAWVARVHVPCLEEVYLVALEANWCFFSLSTYNNAWCSED